MANGIASNEDVINVNSHQSVARLVVDGILIDDHQHAHRHEPAVATKQCDIDELVAEIFDLPVPPTNDRVVMTSEPEDVFATGYQYPTLDDALTTGTVNEFFDTTVRFICKRDLKKLHHLKSDEAKQHYTATVNDALQLLDVRPIIAPEGTKTWQCGFCDRRIDSTKNIIVHVSAHIKRGEYDDTRAVHSGLEALRQFFK